MNERDQDLADRITDLIEGIDRLTTDFHGAYILNPRTQPFIRIAEWEKKGVQGEDIEESPGAIAYIPEDGKHRSELGHYLTKMRLRALQGETSVTIVDNLDGVYRLTDGKNTTPQHVKVFTRQTQQGELEVFRVEYYPQ